MTYSYETSVIGVDGGGTNCRFALVHDGSRVDLSLDAANVMSDPQGALATLRAGLDALAQKAGLTAEEVHNVPAYLGLAGVVDHDMSDWIARSLPLHCARVGDDRRTAMVGALGSEDGFVVGIGTGSFFGRHRNGTDHLVGGWGFALGDEASGAALGRDLLRATLAAHDRVGEASAITQAALAQFGKPSAIVAFAKAAAPKDFAAFAPQIVAAGSEGDPVAARLMADGATKIEATLGAMGWTDADIVCPVGGLAAHYNRYLSADLAARIKQPKGSALDGALALAQRLMCEGEPA